MMPTRSYLSQCDKVITFGLGDATTVDEVTVKWPGGKSEVFSVEGIDRTIRLVEGASRS